MLVDEDGDFVSQRKVPELALVVPVIGSGSITLTAPGMDDTELALDSRREGERLVTATVHGNAVTGQLVGEEMDAWFTELLAGYGRRERFRLLRTREQSPRVLKERYRRPDASNTFAFADGSPMLLASESSLERLNGELDEPVPMNRFRPNIVVGGEDLEPYAEDRWTLIRIGALRTYVVKPCARCVVTDVDQETARVGKAVRRALTTRAGVSAYDRDTNGVFFAQNLNHVYEPETTVRVGDPVEVLETRPDPNVILEPPRMPDDASPGGR